MPASNNAAAETIPCNLHLERAAATPAQQRAWECLWRLLLAEEAELSPGRGEEGKRHGQTWKRHKSPA